MVRPFKVVVLGKDEKERIWEYAYLVFARSKKEAIQLAVEEAKSRNLTEVRLFKAIEYKKPIVWAELHGAWPEGSILDELDAIGGYEALPKVEG